MTQSLATTSLFNSFKVFREILQGITTFTTVFPKAKFDEDGRYFEDEPNPKARSFPGYPVIIIDTDMDDEHIAYKNLKQMNYTTRIIIQTEYSVELDTPRLNSYMNAIADYLNTNQGSLLNSYGIDGIRVTKSRDRDEIAEIQLVVGIITIDYNTKLDVEQ